MTGAELKALRKSLGLSLAQAARQVEVSVRTWARWETSDTVPPGAVKLFEIQNGIAELPKEQFKGQRYVQLIRAKADARLRSISLEQSAKELYGNDLGLFLAAVSERDEQLSLMILEFIESLKQN